MLEKKVQQGLEQAGVTINGTQPFDIQVHDKTCNSAVDGHVVINL